ncbi:MAG: ROK family protein [Elusimicrobiota bacterium]
MKLGIDLGGTSAKIALVGENLKILKETSVVSSGNPSPLELTKKISSACFSLVHGKKISKVGVGVAGDIDFDKGIVRISPNLGWKKVPLKKLFEKNLKAQVIVDNDANVAAWGLYKTQVPPHVKNIIVMTLGTGVGGGIIIDGKLLRGATGSAGEIGHMNIEEKGPLCNCGNLGCLETYIGGPHIVKKVLAGIKAGKKTILSKVYKNNPDDISPLAVSNAAKAGDSFAKSIWDEASHMLGLAIGDLVYLLNPERIYFTGGVAQAKNSILSPLFKTLYKRTFKTPIHAVKIQVAENAPNIGVIGASLL